ncbi:MAG: D-tyrosyl-tRNA(Tyr) deacylase [Acholeplasmatales bacterium]|nr:D-tyrosyl-tRNA(Tyr) deacylase [Acholeplasmatales bacterium]
MRVVVQRVKNATCHVDGKLTGKCDNGFMILVGFTLTDTEAELKLLAKKVAGLRVFNDENMKMNKSLKDINGTILSISQFTLYADAKHGNRPSFTEALPGDKAKVLYDKFNNILRTEYNLHVEEGIFGADMKVQFLNDGPVTIILDSKEL